MHNVLHAQMHRFDSMFIIIIKQFERLSVVGGITKQWTHVLIIF